jgi:hypothetical protein
MPINIYDITKHTDLENFNHVIALNLDEMKAFIDEVSDNLSIEFVDEKYFGIIAALLNVDLNKSEDPNLQRQQLRTALDTIRSKGTVECFKVFMYNFGLTVDVIPLWTPDYYEELEVVPPYIKAGPLEPMNAGVYSITVINPDQQIQTVEKLFTIIA